jgi:DNA invertase Pin-like site-specific DNA recombinase
MSMTMAKRQIRPSANTVQPGAPKVFGYCRVSSTDQKENGVSLAEQERRIRGRALEQGWTITEIFVEEAVSGSVPLDERPQGARLLRAVAAGDVVICAKLDRAFRSAIDALQTIADFKRRKISLWVLDIGGDCSGNGVSELVMTILAAVAQFERERIGERIRDAKAQLRHQGLHQGGQRPFGWRLGEGGGRTGRTFKLIPDEAEQAAIATMRTMRTAGATLMQIRDRLRAQGHQISHQSVANILARVETAAAGEAA